MLVYLAEDQIPRYLTAISRRALSVPMRLLRRAGLARGTILDFGCGKGDDVAALRRAGLDARGYDPHFAPADDLAPADTVNVGYVLNVIEDPAERLRVLRRAWALTRHHLGVGVRVDAIQGRKSGDGVITSSGTFQKSYSTKELRALVRGVTGVDPRVLAPGVVVATRPHVSSAS